MIKIKIIRHSERLDYTYPLYWLTCFGQYWSDSPLTTNGHKIAREKGKKLLSDDDFFPSHIYTSPYTRTFATASEIRCSCSNAELVIEPLISEYQPKYKDKINLYPNGIPTTYSGEETDFLFPESYDDFIKRVHFIVMKLINKHSTDFMIVTHGEVLKVLIRYLQDSFPEIMLDPGNTPYLTTLSFIYDKNEETIIEESVKLE